MPDPRVGDRQQVCCKPECKKAFRDRTQADWRRRDPGYFVEWRARERQNRHQQEEPVEPLRVPAPLARLPWAMAQREFGVAGTDFLGAMGRLLLVRAKDEMRSQPAAV